MTTIPLVVTGRLAEDGTVQVVDAANPPVYFGQDYIFIDHATGQQRIFGRFVDVDPIRFERRDVP